MSNETVIVNASPLIGLFRAGLDHILVLKLIQQAFLGRVLGVAGGGLLLLISAQVLLFLI